VEDLARRINRLSPERRLLLELQLQRKKRLPEPIAVVGIACRLPGAPNPQAFWQLLQTGQDAIQLVPPDRWPLEQFYDAAPAAVGKTYCRWGGFLDQVDQFDPGFFGIAPREAAYIDPQQRLFLETVWESLEDAGIPPQSLAGQAVGVFAGASTLDYGQGLLQGPDIVDTYTTTGLASTMVANRVSYLLDLQGPSMTVDTACSSSLVAVHLACQSLWRGETTLALAGGVNVILTPTLTIGFQQAHGPFPGWSLQSLRRRGQWLCPFRRGRGNSAEAAIAGVGGWRLGLCPGSGQGCQPGWSHQWLNRP
jgi:acyl transferase domain-containing protein